MKLCDVSPPELREVLARLAPPTVAVRVLAKPLLPRLRPMPRQQSVLPPMGVPLPLAGSTSDVSS